MRPFLTLASESERPLDANRKVLIRCAKQPAKTATLRSKRPVALVSRRARWKHKTQGRGAQQGQGSVRGHAAEARERRDKAREREREPLNSSVASTPGSERRLNFGRATTEYIFSFLFIFLNFIFYFFNKL